MKLKLTACLLMLMPLFGLHAQSKVKPIPDSIRVFTNMDSAFAHPDKVFAIDLSKRRTGAFPNELYKFKNLQYLNLSANRILGIPEEVGRLKNLKRLDLSKNNLTTLPDSIGYLANLEELILYKNDIDTIPKSIGNLSKLELLDLWENEISSLPDELGKLRSLKTLDLRGILFNEPRQKYLQDLMPNAMIYFSPPCNCKD
jgi:hypothetical protein